MQGNFLQEHGKIQIPFEWSYEKKVAKSYWKINICASSQQNLTEVYL